MSFPALTADFVGCLEIVGGLLLLLGLLTRPIAVLFLIEMTVAMLSTKISMYSGPHRFHCRRCHLRPDFGRFYTKFAPNMRSSWSLFTC